MLSPSWPNQSEPEIKSEQPSTLSPQVQDLLATHEELWPRLRQFPELIESISAIANAVLTIRNDVALWQFLGHLMVTHSHWSDAQCSLIIRCCSALRARSDWQQQLLTYWPRWKQHHRSFIEGIQRIDQQSWQDKCQFCEIWSANRPIMAPFSGVAELLLTHSKRTAPLPPASSHITSTSPHSHKTLLIVTADASIERFSESGASRQLLWALKQSGLNWTLFQPWQQKHEIDWAAVSGVLFWSYRFLKQDYVFHAIALERVCVKRNIPVLNSISQGWDMRHSTMLTKMRAAGAPCPRHQHFENIEDITLDYPLILRVDGLHRGQQMKLVENPDVARTWLQQKRSEFLKPQLNTRTLPPPNLAVEFINVAGDDGLYEKYRALVIGDRVLLRHQLTSHNWLVNFGSSVHRKKTGIKDTAVGHSPIEEQALVKLAAHATGSDITAIDYSIKRDGGYMFWEANRIFMMKGDQQYGGEGLLECGDQYPHEEENAAIGDALLELLKTHFVLAAH